MIRYSKILLILLIAILIIAFGLNAFLSNSLGHQVELLESHAEAMVAGEVNDSDSFSISNLRKNFTNLRWTSYVAIAASFSGIFLLSALLFQRTAKRNSAEGLVEADPHLPTQDGTSNFGDTPSQKSFGFRNSFVRDLTRNQLVQFSIASFVIMLVLAVSITAVVSTRLNLQMDLLTSHGAAMMSGELDTMGPASIPNMISEVRNLIETIVIIVSTSFVILYLSLVTIFWRGGIERKQLESSLRIALTEVETIAKTDYLSGLLNRRAIQEKANIDLNRGRRESTDVSFILLDIDKFKQINDQFGHLMGDQALQRLANNLMKNKRPYDSIGRWGGDEFIMILPSTNLQEAATVAKRIKKLVSSLNIELPDKSTQKILVSLGVSSTSNNNGDELSMSDLLHQADLALYEAKRLGRNQIKKYSRKGLTGTT